MDELGEANSQLLEMLERWPEEKKGRILSGPPYRLLAHSQQDHRAALQFDVILFRTDH